MVTETTRWSFKLFSKTDHHLGNIDWHASLGWHDNLDLYDTLGRHGYYDLRVLKVDMVFYVILKDTPLSR